jgi:superfamily II DNA or RNA helicase
MSSEVFSRTLLKVNLKYTLGLTATPERTDQLTHVFLKFLGPIVYKYTKDTSNSLKLVVKHIKYISDDNKYNSIEKTKSNNICVPRMINNITEYDNRNLLIVNVLHYLVQNPERNIILLSDRREHLKTLYELLDKDIKIGFYVGGLKQQILDITANNCQIILSTYSMAAEALDIPKLNCLVLSSPKVNVEQSVGRILRKKHSENSLPIVIDIEDHFSIFKNQYKKRLTYYKSNNYPVENININDETDFKTIEHILDYNNIKKVNIKTYIKKKCNITKN